jgi:hypothetical protein
VPYSICSCGSFVRYPVKFERCIDFHGRLKTTYPQKIQQLQYAGRGTLCRPGPSGHTCARYITGWREAARRARSSVRWMGIPKPRIVILIYCCGAYGTPNFGLSGVIPRARRCPTDAGGLLYPAARARPLKKASPSPPNAMYIHAIEPQRSRRHTSQYSQQDWLRHITSKVIAFELPIMRMYRTRACY